MSVIKALRGRSQEIYNDIFDAMQQAEEIDGVEGVDYVNLMSIIATEALHRMSYVAITELQTKEKKT
jgi:hypothetical protein